MTHEATTGTSARLAIAGAGRDVAYPLVRDAQAKGVAVRASHRVAARAFWREPFAPTRVRVTSPTAENFRWP